MDDVLTNITDLFLGNGLIIVIGCFVVGMFLKGSIKNLPNKFIPYINIIVAIVLGFVIPGTFEDEFIVSKIIILSFLGLSSVGLYEILCIMIKDRFSIDIKQIYNNMIKSKGDTQDQMQKDILNEEDDNGDYWEFFSIYIYTRIVILVYNFLLA